MNHSTIPSRVEKCWLSQVLATLRWSSLLKLLQHFTGIASCRRVGNIDFLNEDPAHAYDTDEG